jgi:hypothetical protein
MEYIVELRTTLHCVRQDTLMEVDNAIAARCHETISIKDLRQMIQELAMKGGDGMMTKTTKKTKAKPIAKPEELLEKQSYVL